MIDAVIDLHQEIKKGNQRLENIEGRLRRLASIEDQLKKNNLAIGELRLSVMRLADRDKAIKDYDRRLRKVETTLDRRGTR